MTGDAFFTRAGDTFEPTDRCRGPWNPESLHGRVISGLLAAEIEAQHGDPDFHPARLTTDMFRVAPFAPVSVTTQVARSGNRIRVVDATLIAGGVEVARASATLLRRAGAPEGEVWTPPPFDFPPPDAIEVVERDLGRSSARDEAWDQRNVAGGTRTAEQAAAWLRQCYPLVLDEETTPFARAAAASDFANPLANSGTRGLEFVNADATLYLHRLPVGEWIGFEVTSHQSAEGIAVGACALYDERGPIGHSTVCSVANRRRGER